MKKSNLSLAILASVLGLPMAQQASAEGFIEDSKASLSMRNLYYSRDVRNQNTPSDKEWGQGFILNFQSGFTQGIVGFGFDATAQYGYRLAQADQGGSVFPLQSPGNAERDYSRFGLTGKMRYSKTVAQVGTLRPMMPVLTITDLRLLPQMFQGVQVTSNEIENLTLTAGRIDHVLERNSSNREGMHVTPTSADSNEFYFAGADYKVNKDLLLQYYYATLDHFYNQHFFGLVHNWALPVGSLKSDLRYFESYSDGRNSNAAGRADGYTIGGYWKAGDANRGEVDNHLWSAMFTYSLKGHALGIGYQQSLGDSDFPHLNSGSGRALYLITNSQMGKFASSGEKTWVGSYSYDFVQLGVPGLKASAMYFNGQGINARGRDNSEWERDLRVDYVLQGGPMKGLGLTLRHASMRGNDAVDQDEAMAIVNYTRPLF